MTIINAFENVYKRMGQQVEPIQGIDKILSDLPKAHADATFSLVTSRKALSTLRGVVPPTGQIELDSYLNELVDELIRAGTEDHGTCSCETTLQAHVYTYYLYYIAQHICIDCSIDFSEITSGSFTLGSKALQDFLKFQPSQN